MNGIPDRPGNWGALDRESEAEMDHSGDEPIVTVIGPEEGVAPGFMPLSQWEEMKNSYAIIEKLYAALRHYGRHEQGCQKAMPTYDTYGVQRTKFIACSCGLDDILNE